MLIRQVELPVWDAVQAARFYGDVLDLPTRTGGGVVQVEVGPSVLLLHPGPVEPGAYHAAITVPKDRFAEAKVWLQKRVSLLERDGLDEFALGAPWNSQSLYYAGPDGILLELIARHDLAAPTCCGSVRSALPCRMCPRRSQVCRTRSDCRCSAPLRQSSPRSAIPTGS
jgi:catechol-2,3-dioxygenase